MEKRIEKWESLRLEAQEFTPQEYVASCESTENITLNVVLTECSKGYIYCPGSTNHILDQYAHSSNITFVPPTSSGTDAVISFWADAYALINESDTFDLYCGDNKVASAKVIVRPSNNITEINSGTLNNFKPGQCGMGQGYYANPNDIVALQEGWQVLQNHSG